MELYNQIIKETDELLKYVAPKRWDFSPSDAWHDNGSSELIMQRDSAYELGGSDKPALNYSCVTTDMSLVAKDEILLYGPDLKEIKADTAYARIAVITVSSMEGKNEEIYKSLCDLEFVKYHVFPTGYMIRISPESNREQVRIGKQSLKDGMSFQNIGSAFIRKYKENPNVKNVKLIFVTDEAADFKALTAHAKSVDSITRTFNHILDGLPTDCSSCQLKPLCDEVEGMRELHFNQEKKN